MPDLDSSDTIIIEEAAAEDAADILALQKLAFTGEAEIYGDQNIPPLTQTLDSLTADFSRYTFLKASLDGCIVGSVRADEQNGTCYIGRLIVDPECQNRGIGKQLMAAIESAFSHVDRYELFTGHLSERNLYFYKKLGYVEFKHEQIHPGLVHVFMEK
ncbi:MAG: GNAT family N-acetyltransferase [Anaerolineae bacterium]|nr:GNAT family N-acetyltransferase [Anaerolineae bacterium]